MQDESTPCTPNESSQASHQSATGSNQNKRKRNKNRNKNRGGANQVGAAEENKETLYGSQNNSSNQSRKYGGPAASGNSGPQ